MRNYFSFRFRTKNCTLNNKSNCKSNENETQNDRFRTFLFRDKYEQFVATWAEQSAWSTVALKEASVKHERGQELILLRKAHLIVRLFFLHH